MEYRLMQNDQKYAILTRRLQRYEQQHYEDTLNLEIAEAMNDEESAKQLRSQLEKVEIAINLSLESLQKLDKPKERTREIPPSQR